MPLLQICFRQNGGFDPETGNTNVIRQSLELQLFGRTASGKSSRNPRRCPLTINFFCSGK